MITRYKEFINEGKKIWTESDPEYYGIKNYVWKNGKLDCYQDVNLKNMKLTKIPFDFGEIIGSFSCVGNNLTSLEGCPQSIIGSFACYNNQLTNLVGCPEKVTYEFNCCNNKLTSLLGAPIEVNSFYCYENNLTDLNYSPKIVNGMFDCQTNNLTSLEGCPEFVKENFICVNNKLRSSIEDYPLCDIKSYIFCDDTTYFFREILRIIKKDRELYIPLMKDKVKFHQMIMRMNPDLIQYYETIPPPPKKTILFDI